MHPHAAPSANIGTAPSRSGSASRARHRVFLMPPAPGLRTGCRVAGAPVHPCPPGACRSTKGLRLKPWETVLVRHRRRRCPLAALQLAKPPAPAIVIPATTLSSNGPRPCADHGINTQQRCRHTLAFTGAAASMWSSRTSAKPLVCRHEVPGSRSAGHLWCHQRRPAAEDLRRTFIR